MRQGATTQPFLVEVIGVAGAGKSTVTKLLSQADDCRVAEFIHTRRPLHLWYVARSLPRLSPILVANLLGKPRLTWADFKLMVYVTEWRQFLLRKTEYSKGVTLLDQGPIYALVRLKARGPAVAERRSFERWWQTMIERWAATLGVVVWLDAPNRVLQSRIDGRVQGHAMKGETTETSREFLTQYRLLFEEALRSVDLPEGPNLLRFDTNATEAHLLASELRSVFAIRSASS